MDDTKKIIDDENVDIDDQIADQESDDTTKSSDDDVVQKLMAQNDDLNNKWKRAVADYQNLEKQVRREKSEFMQFASANVMERFLPILDHMEQATSGMTDEEKKSGWAVGVLMTVKMFRDMLKDEGMVEIKAEGATFDAHKMEAVEAVEGEKDKVIKVLRKGYECFGKVVRPVQVIIGKGE
jgi:molecular chaperone GrpE